MERRDLRKMIMDGEAKQKEMKKKQQVKKLSRNFQTYLNYYYLNKEGFTIFQYKLVKWENIRQKYQRPINYQDI